MTKDQIKSLILLGVSILYVILPTDIIPDIPVVGWIDDALVTSSAAVNCIQQFSDDGDAVKQKILDYLKWTLFSLLGLVILVLVLIVVIAGSTAYAIFN